MAPPLVITPGQEAVLQERFNNLENPGWYATLLGLSLEQSENLELGFRVADELYDEQPHPPETEQDKRLKTLVDALAFDEYAATTPDLDLQDAGVWGSVPVTGHDSTLTTLIDRDSISGLAGNTEGYTYSSTQFNLPEPLANSMREYAQTVPDSELTGKGREDSPHLTIKYGLYGDNAIETLKRILPGYGLVKVTLGRTGIFQVRGSAGDWDVLKVEVRGDKLEQLHRLIEDSVASADQHAAYNPHITLVYLKAGEGFKYAGDAKFEGTTVSFDTVIYSPTGGGNLVPISLAAQPETIQAPAGINLPPVNVQVTMPPINLSMPANNVAINVPTQPVPDVYVSPAQVNVTMPELPVPNISVLAPNVTVTPSVSVHPRIEVQAPLAPEVNVQVNLPEPKDKVKTAIKDRETGAWTITEETVPCTATPPGSSGEDDKL